MIVIKIKKMLAFTLIELIISVAIVGILAAIVYPSYSDFVSRSNRSEGQRELVRIANLQEQFFVDNRVYTEDMTKLGLNAQPFLTELGHYSINATVTGATFILQATAINMQAEQDTDCPSLSITHTGNITPAECWEN
jgi:type IV pilus assembly protein PilE